MLNIKYNLENIDKIEAGLIKDATNFYIDYLNIQAKHLYYSPLIISTSDKYNHLSKDTNGYVASKKMPNSESELFICLKTKPIAFPLLEILAHEMIHAKQHATGELKQTITNQMLWHNELINQDNTFLYIIGLEQSPWEKEAYSRQKELYKAFIHHIRMNG